MQDAKLDEPFSSSSDDEAHGEASSSPAARVDENDRFPGLNPGSAQATLQDTRVAPRAGAKSQARHTKEHSNENYVKLDLRGKRWRRHR